MMLELSSKEGRINAIYEEQSLNPPCDLNDERGPGICDHGADMKGGRPCSPASQLLKRKLYEAEVVSLSST